VTETAHSNYLATRHFAALDGLRCLSIVPVIWHHSTPRPLPGLLGKGPAGVD
jgi:peptidoglycan/LPS O-acetylase OafA/YrhL